MKKTKILLSCAMMLMLSVSVFAGHPQKDVKDCKILPQDSECEMFFMFNIDMPQDRCPMFNRHNKEQMKHFGKNHDKNFRKDFFKKSFEDLNLTDKQKEDLQNLKKSTMEANVKLFKEFKEKIKEVNDEFLNENYSSKNIKTLNKELNEIASKVINNSIDKKKELRKIFTFEQYTKLFKHKTRYDILAKKLNLSDEQKGKVEKIINDRNDKIKELKETKFEKKHLLEQELEKENYNKDTVENLVKEISNISNDILQLKTNSQIELKSVLNSEQYNKLNNFHKRDNMKMHKMK